MTSFKFARIAALALVACGASAAFADTANLTVSATITAACKFTTTNPTMSFSVDPSSASAATATSSVTYKCTKGTTSGTFSVGGVSNGTTGYLSGTTQGTGALYSATSTDAMQFSINWTTPTGITGSGFGTGSTGQTVSLSGSIDPAQFANAGPANDYTATVQLAVLP